MGSVLCCLDVVVAIAIEQATLCRRACLKLLIAGVRPCFGRGIIKGKEIGEEEKEEEKRKEKRKEEKGKKES